MDGTDAVKWEILYVLADLNSDSKVWQMWMVVAHSKIYSDGLLLSINQSVAVLKDNFEGIFHIFLVP